MIEALQPAALSRVTTGGERIAVAGGMQLSDGAAGKERRSEPESCTHCGEPCDRGVVWTGRSGFCCIGCQTVYSLLHENGLGAFYDMAPSPGLRAQTDGVPDRWGFLDDPAVAAKLLDFNDGKTARVTLHLPGIHCVACVWLLENLFRLNPAIGSSRVNFARREIAIAFAPDRIRLSEVAALLAGLGYAPELSLAELDRAAGGGSPARRLGLRIGVAGFAFGNIMLFSLPLYLGLDSVSGPMFRAIFGWLSLALALPVVVFSASDYWRAALVAWRRRILTLDVPIALGLAALYLQSAWEIALGRGGGYLDSLAGLVFLLLCGRVFQQKTQERLAFDLDYRGFFPLGVRRRTARGEETVSLSNVAVGDRLVVRHSELVPADARLVAGEGLVDYSFVTGESEPVPLREGDRVYAGGRQAGAGIEVEVVKPVSESYLAGLWNEDAFRKDRDDAFNTLTNRYSRRFTRLVVAIAVGAAVGWTLFGDAPRGLKSFASVLIVACPCALALAAPVTLGTAHRLLARRGVCLRNAGVLETIARVDAVAFDKTGTLTVTDALRVGYRGSDLRPDEATRLAMAFAQSTHPYSRRLAGLLSPAGGGARTEMTEGMGGFREVAGRGIVARVDGHLIAAGSASWLRECGAEPGQAGPEEGGTVFLAIDGRFRGVFVLGNELRPEIAELIRRLGSSFEIALISGDNERERRRFSALFGGDARLHFNLSPREKLGFIRRLQDNGHTVMMVGDGLNDAGALRQGDVGVAVVEGPGRFSPASDVIMEAAMVPRIAEVVQVARYAVRIVRASFGVSAAYNAVGIAIAAAGWFSPLICAVLMPVSSATVVAFAAGLMSIAAGRAGFGPGAACLSRTGPVPVAGSA